MQKKEMAVAVAIILLAVIACILAWNLENTIEKIDNETNGTEIAGNVSNETVDTNNTNDTNDTDWVWSGQQEDFIKDFNDSEGNEHIIYKSSGDELVFMKDGSVFLNGKNITDEWNKDFN